MDVLRLRFVPDDEWTGALLVNVAFGAFSGVGQAWFSKDDLKAFAASLAAFPLPPGKRLETSGGLGGNDSSPAQDLISICFEPYNKVGAVRASVHLETENWDGKNHGLYSECTIRFLITYGDLARFGPAMLDVVNGQIAEAVLTSTP